MLCMRTCAHARCLVHTHAGMHAKANTAMPADNDPIKPAPYGTKASATNVGRTPPATFRDKKAVGLASLLPQQLVPLKDKWYAASQLNPDAQASQVDTFMFYAVSAAGGWPSMGPRGERGDEGLAAGCAAPCTRKSACTPACLRCRQRLLQHAATWP